MTSSGTDASSSTEDIVYESARRLLAERDEKEGEVASWLLGSEVTRDTKLDKDVVMQALVALGSDRLRVKMAGGGDEVEILGLAGTSGPADDSAIS